MSASAEEYFYPGAVLSVLGLERMDYAQLRTLLALVRDVPVGELREGSGWLRVSLADVAGLRIAIALVGGPEVFRPGKRMRLTPLRSALAALRQMGIENPLIEVPLALHGSRVVASVNGIVLDPKTGQTLLSQTHGLLREDLLSQHPVDRRSLQRLRADLSALHEKLSRRTTSGDGDIEPLPTHRTQ